MATITILLSGWSHFTYIPIISSTNDNNKVITNKSYHAHRLFYWGIGAYLIGTCIWIIDNVLCYSHMIPIKQTLGYPWRIILEGHGWWHLLSGYGCYLVINCLIVARHNALIITHHPMVQHLISSKIIWHGGFLPEIIYLYQSSSSSFSSISDYKKPY